MSHYISTPRLIVRTLFHFAIYPYVVGILVVPIIIYLLLAANVDMHGNILKLYEEMGLVSDFQVYSFSIFAIFAIIFPIAMMIGIYRKFGRFSQLAFVVTLYFFVPSLTYLFFNLI
ncbi:MAG: hypothetical protein AAF228_09940 [Pseudomonadota bacterium]